MNEPEDSFPVASILNNAILPQCDADALLARIIDSAHASTYGNDDGGVCE